MWQSCTIGAALVQLCTIGGSGASALRRLRRSIGRGPGARRAGRRGQEVRGNPSMAPQQRLGAVSRHLTAAVEAPETTAEDELFGELPTYSWSEVAQHNTLESLWVVVRGRVFDMTEFVTSGVHPGGDEIPMEYGGKDVRSHIFCALRPPHRTPSGHHRTPAGLSPGHPGGLRPAPPITDRVGAGHRVLGRHPRARGGGHPRGPDGRRVAQPRPRKPAHARRALHGAATSGARGDCGV
eukprot:COSAG04_NODE_476_length_13722_cov_16.614707_14_plen_238_part_00